MAIARVGIVVAAAIAAPTLVFEPHLQSGVNRQAIEEHEMGMLSQLAQAGAVIYNADCKGCHVPAQSTDWIYVEGYPVLKKN